MSGYVKNLLLVMVVCSLVQFLAPEFSGRTKQSIRLLSSLVVLLTVITPILGGCRDSPVTADQVESFFSSYDTTGAQNDVALLQAALQGAVRETAYAVMYHIHANYEIPTENISVTIVTEEGDDSRITEVQIFLFNCTPADREQIRRDLMERIDADIYIFGRGKSP